MAMNIKAKFVWRFLYAEKMCKGGPTSFLSPYKQEKILEVVFLKI